MPRDGSGVFSAPAGTLATPNTTILSANYNAFVNDLVSDANAARPTTAGGTGATTAIGAHDALVTKGTDIASAATLNLSTATGAFVDITGTTTVTAVTLGEGEHRMARAVAAFQLTASASLVVNGSTSTNYTTTAGDLLLFEGYSSNVVRVWAVPGGRTEASYPTGHLSGLTLSNNATDATNDIDIAAGTARDGSNTVNMDLASALTKRLDAAWAAGTGNGGLDTGSIANGTYHIWLIKRSDTGVVDALFSTSASAPTMPTNYDYKRRIGSITRASAAIVGFVQDGDRFTLKAPPTNITATNPGASAVTATLSPIPTGIRVAAIVSVYVLDLTIATATILRLSDLSTTDTTTSSGNFTFTAYGTIGSPGIDGGEAVVMTNTSAQIRYRLNQSDGDISINILPLGWIDTRGRT